MTVRSSPADVLTSAVATGVGSLPHTDPDHAVDLSTAATPVLPFAPQLPRRDPREGMIAQWLGALPEVEIDAEGTVTPSGAAAGPIVAAIEPDHHGGLVAFVERLHDLGRVPAVKAQVTGPLTLATALREAGIDARAALDRASEAVSAWSDEIVGVIHERRPELPVVLFLDEPSLVQWQYLDPPFPREDAVDALSHVLADIDAITGVHVCGDGVRRMAFEAGPDIVGFPVKPSVLEDGLAVCRFVDGGGWIAWGAVPTDRPVGERSEHWTNDLVALWRDLVRGGCDARRLAEQALITPACGLAQHAVEQAERILAHCATIAAALTGDDVVTRLSVGA